MQSYILTRSRLYRENLGTPDYQQRGLYCLRPRCGKIRVGVMNSVKLTRCLSVLDSTMDIPQDFSAADRNAKEALDKKTKNPTADLMPFSDIKPLSAKHVYQLWQKEWDETIWVSNKFHEILPKPPDKLLSKERRHCFR